MFRANSFLKKIKTTTTTKQVNVFLCNMFYIFLSVKLVTSDHLWVYSITDAFITKYYNIPCDSKLCKYLVGLKDNLPNQYFVIIDATMM